MKKIKLLTSLVGGVGLSIGLVPVITGCSSNKSKDSVELDESVTKQNVSVKTFNIQQGKDSTIELNLPPGKFISKITIEVSNTTLYESDVNISGSTITIPAAKMSAAKVIIKSITLTETPGPTPVLTKAVGFKNTSTDGKITISYANYVKDETYMQISYDGLNWTDAPSGTVSELIPQGGTLYIRGKGFSGKQMFDLAHKIDLNDGGSWNLLGSINNLVDYTKNDAEISYADAMFQYGFSYNTNLISLSEDFLPQKVLAPHCYEDMFYGCSNLINAPKLPATELKDCCYGYMFCACSKLKINNTGEKGTLFFTCPSTTGLSFPVDYMFTGTGGSYTSKPVTDGKYYFEK